MIDPLLWQSVPFDDPDAWTDFLWEHAQWHRRLDEGLDGVSSLPMDDLRVQLDRHQALHDAENQALGLGRASDLQSYDLTDRVAYYTWMQLHAVETQLQRLAAGL